MASFIVRIELRNADVEGGDYERLDAEMHRRDFLKSIPDAGGKWYRLPQGEYFYQGHKTAAYICEMGEQAAANIGKHSRILAAEIVTVAFDLEPVEKPV